MKLFNTKTQATGDFAVQDQQVTVYVCGITPYDTTHLGHAFTYVSYDHLIRYLEMQGITVRYAQNVTDIDDDILKRSRELGEDWRALGSRWTDHFIDDMIALNVRPPDFYPRATDVIPEIIQSVAALIREGIAYESSGSVYYSVERYPAFGQLSHLERGEMLPVANERGNRPDDPHKRDPLDFVLWQAQAPGEPAWDSPWGPGRPGWHIECSTMSTKYLGIPVDIHGGGLDLCFPHHECEIAQIQPVQDEAPYVRTWMHTAMVGYQGEKMSKSLGNLIMVSDLLKTYSSDAIRLYLASHHYREAWSYEEKDLQRYQAMADRFRQASQVEGGQSGPYRDEDFTRAFTQAMENDLWTLGAVQALEGLLGGILRAVAEGEDVREAQNTLRRYGQVFGLTFSSAPEERVMSGWTAKKRD